MRSTNIIAALIETRKRNARKGTKKVRRLIGVGRWAEEGKPSCESCRFAKVVSGTEGRRWRCAAGILVRIQLIYKQDGESFRETLIRPRQCERWISMDGGGWAKS